MKNSNKKYSAKQSIEKGRGSGLTARPQGRGGSDIDKDVEEILKLAEQMKEAFKRLEQRKTFTIKQADAIADAAKAFRWLRALQLSLLRAAFDEEYAAFLESLNVQAKTKGKKIE